MASPISFGDAYTMAKIAYRLGRAFTKGRKSAPAEFHEVENQLYALSTALESLKQATDEGKIAGRPQHGIDNEPITIMLANCNETLSHLDNLVKEYGSLSSSGDKDTGSETAFTRIGKKIKRNWQTIQWTTEGGDLATLRSQLIFHTNSLGLVLGAVNNARTAKMSTQVSESAEKIPQKLYRLLLTDTESSGDGRTVVQPTFEIQDSHVIIYFKLQGDGFDCQRAAFHLPDGLKHQTMEKQSHIFESSICINIFSIKFPNQAIRQPKVLDYLQDEEQRYAPVAECDDLLCESETFEKEFVDRIAVRKTTELLHQAANSFELKLREMQMDLFAIGSMYPRLDESLLLHLQAEEISCEDLHIENGIIEIVVSRKNNRHRLIIRSEDGYAALSQE
ncbi:hypothetical protein FAGAP_8884 [Fusarium agapanthi]|uniref:Fungal N-terminal domain-containing protein n=1 Tax=Fusarium agapanthi TaxID=1803897 RepID=A0A9P5B5F5_9HYPO|nr:hypothetical protein FAGAP_8884 [Fusarium agapanthi]